MSANVEKKLTALFHEWKALRSPWWTLMRVNLSGDEEDLGTVEILKDPLGGKTAEYRVWRGSERGINLGTSEGAATRALKRAFILTAEDRHTLAQASKGKVF